jgi:hypothetical protein
MVEDLVYFVITIVFSIRRDVNLFGFELRVCYVCSKFQLRYVKRIVYSTISSSAATCGGGARDSGGTTCALGRLLVRSDTRRRRQLRQEHC